MPTPSGREANLNTANALLNRSFDDDFGVIVVEPLSYDGTNLQRPPAVNTSIKTQIVGPVTYFAKAAPGTLQSEAKWQGMKIDETGGNVVLTWADGNSNFDNVATDLSVLNFS